MANACFGNGFQAYLQVSGAGSGVSKCLILLHFTSICEESGCDAVRSINACFLLVLQAFQAFPVRFRSISARCANACFLLRLQAFPEPFTDLGSIPLPLEMLVFYWFYKHLHTNCDPRAHFLQNASNSTRFTSISSICHDSRPMPANRRGPAQPSQPIPDQPGAAQPGLAQPGTARSIARGCPTWLT